MTSVIPKSEAACFKTQKGWSQLRPAFIVATTTRTSQPVMCDRYLIPRLGGIVVRIALAPFMFGLIQNRWFYLLWPTRKQLSRYLSSFGELKCKF